MKTYLASLITIVCLGVCCLGFAETEREDWKVLKQDTNGKFSYDASSVRHTSNDTITVWAKSDVAKYQYEIDCKKRKARVLPENGDSGSMWFTVTGPSEGEVPFKEVCPLKLKVMGEKKNIKDVFYFTEGRWINLTNYKKPNHIYDYNLSPDGNYAFVWHMEHAPRLLSIYDMRKLVLLKELKPGYGGDMEWTQENNLVHVYGCGSGCQVARVLNLEGETLFEIGGSPIEVSPSGRYFALFTVSWVGKQNFELYDFFNKHLIGLKTPLFTINGVGQVYSIDWHDEKRLTIKYTDSAIDIDTGSGKETYISREVSVDLGNY